MLIVLLSGSAEEGGRKLPGSGARLGPRPRPEVTAPGTEKPRCGAEWRARFAKRADAARGLNYGCAPPRSIPSALCRGAKEVPRESGEGRRRTRGHPNNPGAHARPFGI